jgi:hypothetical protein
MSDQAAWARPCGAMNLPFPVTRLCAAIHEPGAQVELGSGDPYRIPKEALIPGASPAIVKESRGASVPLKVIEDRVHRCLQGEAAVRSAQR